MPVPDPGALSEFIARGTLCIEVWVRLRYQRVL